MIKLAMWWLKNLKFYVNLCIVKALTLLKTVLFIDV